MEMTTEMTMEVKMENDEHWKRNSNFNTKLWWKGLIYSMQKYVFENFLLLIWLIIGKFCFWLDWLFDCLDIFCFWLDWLFGYLLLLIWWITNSYAKAFTVMFVIHAVINNQWLCPRGYQHILQTQHCKERKTNPISCVIHIKCCFLR